MSLFGPGEVGEAEEAARRLMNVFGGGHNSSSTIHVNAGGVGVWIATTACAIMLAVAIVGALWVSREFARYDAQIAELRERDNTHQGYLNAIYRAAPSLNPDNAKESK